MSARRTGFRPRTLVLALCLGAAQWRCAAGGLSAAARPGIDFLLPSESPPFPLDIEKEFDTPPRLLKQTKPEYPRWAFDHRIEGMVKVEIMIGIDGRVSAWRIAKSIPELDAAAVYCVRHWIFSPAVKSGRPVAVIADAPVTFRID